MYKHGEHEANLTSAVAISYLQLRLFLAFAFRVAIGFSQPPSRAPLLKLQRHRQRVRGVRVALHDHDGGGARRQALDEQVLPRSAVHHQLSLYIVEVGSGASVQCTGALWANSPGTMMLECVRALSKSGTRGFSGGSVGIQWGFKLICFR